jgi:hypothetical protein
MFNYNEYFHRFKNYIFIYSLIVFVFLINKTFAEILSINDHHQNLSETNSTVYFRLYNDEFNWNIWKIIIIFIAILLALITGVGNLLVVQAFRINKQLRTISNYFLLSLAIADLTIGFVSIPIFTAYFVANKWLLGPIICDLWLCIDVRFEIK